jgi:acyl carrier protein
MRDWLADYICSVLEVEREGFPFDAGFDSLGLDSVEAVILAGMMEERFAVAIDPADLFNHPTATRFARHVAGLAEKAGQGAAGL